MSKFWTNGYEATSVDEICEASGLSKSSLYSAFGDKHALLLHAMRRYIERRVEFVRLALSRKGSIQEALLGLIEQIIDDVIAGPGRRGCFLGNCAAEISRRDRAAMSLIRAGLAEMENVFRQALARALACGDIRSDLDVDASARFLVAGYQGLRLVGKASPDRKMLQDVGSVLLRCLT